MSILYNDLTTKQHMCTKFHLVMDIGGVTQDLTEKIISAKMIQEKPMFPDSVPISTLEVVINDPEGVYDITKKNGLVEIAEVNQLANVNVDMTPMYFVRSTSGQAEWVTGNTQNFDLGEWYFNKSSYKNNALTMQFYDEMGVNDKLVAYEETPIYFYGYNSDEIVSSGTAPFDSDITERDVAKYYLLPYPVSESSLREFCTQTIKTKPLTEQPNIELKQKVTGVTIQGRRFRAKYDQSNIKSHQQWAKNIDYSKGGDHSYNSMHLPLNGILGVDGYYEETLNVTMAHFSPSYSDDGEIDCYRAGLRLSKTYLPYTFKIFAMKGDSIVSTLDYLTTSMSPDIIQVRLANEADFDCIKIRAVPAEMLVCEYLEPGTYTRTFPDTFINDSIEVFSDYAMYKLDVKIDRARQHSLTFTVGEYCKVKIGQQQLVEERIEATATVANAASLAENTRTLYNPSMNRTVSKAGLQADANTCLSLLNEYPYSVKVKLYPQITDQSTYDTSLGEFTPDITVPFCNFFNTKGIFIDDLIQDNVEMQTYLLAMKPGTIFDYRPAANRYNRLFSVWIEHIETDLTGGCIRTISGSARAN